MEPRPFRLDPTGSDIHAEAVLLRERGPATLVELPGGVLAWSVTSYQLIRQLLSDPRISKDPNQHWPTWINGKVPHDWPLLLWVAVKNMFTAYGNDHSRLRTLVSTAFTPRRTATLRPRVEELTAGLLDNLAATPHGEPVDLRARFAYPLPIQVICELFGVPDATRDNLRTAVDSAFNTTADPDEVQTTQQQLYTFLADVIAAKRDAPGDDMTSDLIVARNEDDGSRLSEAELFDTLILVISAGFETTVNLIDHAIHALLTHPDQLRLIRTGQATWEDAVEETLRWQAPVPHLPLRYAIEDVKVGDITIRKGEAILASYGAAGRDPAVHGDTANSFDITRPTRRRHLAFGHGTHHCLGVSLARLEAGIALPAIFDRFPNLALAVPANTLRPVTSFLANGHQSLPVHLHPDDAPTAADGSIAGQQVPCRRPVGPH